MLNQERYDHHMKEKDRGFGDGLDILDRNTSRQRFVYTFALAAYREEEDPLPDAHQSPCHVVRL